MKILVVDTETDHIKTGANILEIAVAGLNTETGETRLLFNSFVQPEHDENNWRSCWFMNNSHLHPNIIESAPKIGALRDMVNKLLAKYPVTAFNLAFDERILAFHQIVMPVRFPCLMQTCTDVVKLPSKFGTYKYPKFSEAWHFFFPDKVFEEKHRAGYDVMAEVLLAKELFRRGILVEAPKAAAPVSAQGSLPVG